METDTSLMVRYWIPTDQPATFDDLKGIDDFRKDLGANYISIVRGRPAGAGGFVHLLVEFVSNLPLSHIVQLLIDGVVYDLIKEGSKSFVLRPFIAAYRKLRARNQERRSIDIGELRIELQDCQVVIHGISSDIVDHLEMILVTLARNYGRLALRSGEMPIEIHIPVFEDTGEERSSRFRVIGDIDETITSKGPEDYVGYWGLAFDRASERKVYYVAQGVLLDETF
jgi:hypothetical protein